MPARFLTALGLAAAFFLFAGCSGKGGQGTVSGTVTIDGTPLAEGTITFVPADGNSPTEGSTIKDGKYTSKSSIGLQKVVINAPKVTGSRKAYADDPNSPVINTTAESLPDKFANPFLTELKLEVKAGNNTGDFSLVTK